MTAQKAFLCLGALWFGGELLQKLFVLMLMVLKAVS